MEARLSAMAEEEVGKVRARLLLRILSMPWGFTGFDEEVPEWGRSVAASRRSRHKSRRSRSRYPSRRSRRLPEQGVLEGGGEGEADNPMAA